MSNIQVIVHEERADRRIADIQINRTFVVTLLGVWIVVFLILFIITPLKAPAVWPLINVVESSTGRKAPDREGDRFLSVTAAGQIFVDEKPVGVASLDAALVENDREVFVRVDKAATFGSVRVLLRAAQRAGRRRLTFLARPRPGA